jgi:chaperonin cofactor prefoldin
MNEWSKAEADAIKCLQAAGDVLFPKGYHRLANAQRKLGRPEDADKTLRRLQQSKKAASPVSMSASSAPQSGQGGIPPSIARELNELQPQFASVQRELQQISMNLQHGEREKKRLVLTQKDLHELPEETALYQSVGKMFLHRTRTENDRYMEKQLAEIDQGSVSLEVCS